MFRKHLGCSWVAALCMKKADSAEQLCGQAPVPILASSHCRPCVLLQPPRAGKSRLLWYFLEGKVSVHQLPTILKRSQHVLSGKVSRANKVNAKCTLTSRVPARQAGYETSKGEGWGKRGEEESLITQMAISLAFDPSHPRMPLFGTPCPSSPSPLLPVPGKEKVVCGTAHSTEKQRRPHRSVRVKKFTPSASTQVQS